MRLTYLAQISSLQFAYTRSREIKSMFTQLFLMIAEPVPFNILDLSISDFNPDGVEPQHGCALVTFEGREGVMVVGGDSGGTRLKDVRFLPIERPSEWERVAALNTARWGRPAVGVVGGRITVAAGWDGTRDLSTVEYYDEVSRKWRVTASRLQTERRWPGATPISLSLFPKCAQRRN